MRRLSLIGPVMATLYCLCAGTVQAQGPVTSFIVENSPFASERTAPGEAAIQAEATTLATAPTELPVTGSFTITEELTPAPADASTEPEPRGTEIRPSGRIEGTRGEAEKDACILEAKP